MSDSTKEKIIRAALKVFSEEGYKGATTRNIASRAGVNESTLFRIFGTKDALYRHILSKNNILLTIIESLKHAPPNDDVQMRLISIANMYKQMYIDNASAIRLLYRCVLEQEELDIINNIIGKNAYHYLKDYFNRLANANHLNIITSCDIAAFLFLSSIHGAIQRDMVFKELSEGPNMNVLVSIFLRGITKA